MTRENMGDARRMEVALEMSALDRGWTFGGWESLESGRVVGELSGVLKEGLKGDWVADVGMGDIAN